MVMSDYMGSIHSMEDGHLGYMLFGIVNWDTCMSLRSYVKGPNIVGHSSSEMDEQGPCWKRVLPPCGMGGYYTLLSHFFLQFQPMPLGLLRNFVACFSQCHLNIHWRRDFLAQNSVERCSRPSDLRELLLSGLWMNCLSKLAFLLCMNKPGLEGVQSDPNTTNTHCVSVLPGGSGSRPVSLHWSYWSILSLMFWDVGGQ